MTNFFQNPNAHSVVVDRVPCAFAKPNRDGSPGTHYTLVIFDKNQSVLYVGSECEHKHGEGVQALHEMGGGNEATCFRVTASFSNALNTIKKQRGKAISRYDDAPRLQAGSPLLGQTFQVAWSAMRDKHNKRAESSDSSGDPYPTFGMKGIMLDNVVRRVSASMLNLPAKVTCGRGKSFDASPCSSISYAPVFRVVETTFRHDTVFGEIVVPAGSTRLALTTNDSISSFLAVREGNQWHIDSDFVKRVASRNHNTIENFEKHGWSSLLREHLGPKIHADEYCIFCAESFTRMSKHLKGGRHINRVSEVVALVTRATSSTGLRMINNPRHRNVFIR